MATKHNLKHSIITTLKRNHDGSFNTQAARKKRLLMMADQLIEQGYKIAHIKQLKLKHVQALVNHWLQQNLSAGTIKNRMTDLRWAAEKHGNAHLIPSSNEGLAIPKRHYITNQDKSKNLTPDSLAKITDEDVKMSLLLQQAFGLRREESIKIKLNQALVGNELRLQGPWCKNGRPRTIKIHYPEQWEVIKQVQAYLGPSKRALIPAHRSYVQQQHCYDREAQKTGLHKLHGLRHAYAQKRYFDLTGWHCPAKGGPVKQQLSKSLFKVF